MRDSSVHRSFYRCVSIHGTSYATLSQNVAYDVTGYCYYLEVRVRGTRTGRVRVKAELTQPVS